MPPSRLLPWCLVLRATTRAVIGSRFEAHTALHVRAPVTRPSSTTPALLESNSRWFLVGASPLNAGRTGPPLAPDTSANDTHSDRIGPLHNRFINGTGSDLK